ncbi:MAG: hypothetical protein PWP48_711 [Clostridiales bacterium]|nr:hypothetical protein [Clostridiales bacterium]MDK2991478.1 hypothetical protein [Clostridiales bacterium]
MQNKILLVNLSKIGYALVLSAIGGYHGYYLQYDHTFLFLWLSLGCCGLALLGYKNYKVYQATKNILFFLLDAIFALMFFYLPFTISLPRGLSIFLPLVVGAVISVILINITFHPWKKSS